MFVPAGLRSARPPARAPAAAPRRRGEPAAWAVFALLGVLLAGYLCFLILRPSDEFSPWFDGWFVVGAELSASCLCIAAGVVGAGRREPALAMGIACLSWTLGDLVLTLESLRGDPATPSLADAFYLAFFPLAFVAVALFVRQEVGRRARPNWLDGAIAGLGMAALCAGFAFHGLEHLFQAPTLAEATNLAYPIGDLLLLGLVAGSVVVAGRGRAALLLLALGLAINASGDTINFVGVADRYETVVDAISWPTSILVIAMSMWLSDRPYERLHLESLATMALPAAVTCGSLAILVAGSWYGFGPIAIGLASVTVVLAGCRLAFRPALRLARERARSSEERYQHLFERHPQPTVAYDRETLQIVAASDAMVAHYGYTREQLHGMSIRDLVPEEDHARLGAYLVATPDGSRATYRATHADHPGRHRLADGTIIDVDVTSTNLDLDGRSCRIAHFDDVTERIRAAAELADARDQAVEASNMKSAFLANVSHEIRTPMNGVLGMTELLLDMGLTAEQLECAQQVARSGEQMLAIINDILDISKIETGHLELDPDDFDLGTAIRETCSAGAVLARLKGVELEVRIGNEVPRRAFGDGRRLAQVVANLVSNAVKFTPSGSIVVRVGAVPADAGSTRVRVEVSDTGIGIDPANVPRMFEPFTQADVSMTRIYGGTGLGLAIARELVELMGGWIDAASELGKGSTFRFEVELAPPRGASPGAVGAQRAVPAWERTPLVLVADDSQINQIVATRALERCGCRARVVSDGVEALVLLGEERYDAVLMDCQMPRLDGYQAVAELRRRELGHPRTPVIAMTAHAMDGDRQRCIDAGMDDYISKPMRHADLAEILMRWIPDRAPAPASSAALAPAPSAAPAPAPPPSAAPAPAPAPAPAGAAGAPSGRRRPGHEELVRPLAREPVERR